MELEVYGPAVQTNGSCLGGYVGGGVVEQGLHSLAPTPSFTRNNFWFLCYPVRKINQTAHGPLAHTAYCRIVLVDLLESLRS